MRSSLVQNRTENGYSEQDQDANHLGDRHHSHYFCCYSVEERIFLGGSGSVDFRVEGTVSPEDLEEVIAFDCFRRTGTSEGHDCVHGRGRGRVGHHSDQKNHNDLARRDNCWIGNCLGCLSIRLGDTYQIWELPEEEVGETYCTVFVVVLRFVCFCCGLRNRFN